MARACRTRSKQTCSSGFSAATVRAMTAWTAAPVSVSRSFTTSWRCITAACITKTRPKAERVSSCVFRSWKRRGRHTPATTHKTTKKNRRTRRRSIYSGNLGLRAARASFARRTAQLARCFSRYFFLAFFAGLADLADLTDLADLAVFAALAGFAALAAALTFSVGASIVPRILREPQRHSYSFLSFFV